MNNLHTYIEHTLLRSTATTKDIIRLCDEAKKYNFYGVCVNSCYVYLASKELKNHSAKVIATVGFPLGTASTTAKVAEARQAVKDGADEIDMVINLGLLKSSLTKSVREDISAVKKVIGHRILKVIIETCYLNNSEIALASGVAQSAGADFIKTSTGFGSKGALIKDVRFMEKAVNGQLEIKASGGIKTAHKAIRLIRAGANRIGTSNGVTIVFDPKVNKK